MCRQFSSPKSYCLHEALAALIGCAAGFSPVSEFLSVPMPPQPMICNARPCHVADCTLALYPSLICHASQQSQCEPATMIHAVLLRRRCCVCVTHCRHKRATMIHWESVTTARCKYRSGLRARWA